MTKSLLGGLRGILLWFDHARPKPDRQDFHVQMGVHFEEVSEMIQEISSVDPETRLLLEKAKQATHLLAEHLKTNHDVIHIETEDEERYLDAICDQVVTLVGCAQGSEMDLVGAVDEVNDSNWSKFVDGKPIRDANGKIAKGPSYFKANLKPFLTR